MAQNDAPPKKSAKSPVVTKAGADAAPAGERIAKVLARAGIASRREAERMIEMGHVAVNGAVITSPALNVTPADRIMVDGKPIAAAEPSRLWLYYKPLGLVTSERDEKGRPTVFENLPEDLPRVMSVGRLDLNSEGLLLLTNDGEIKRRLELPSTGWLRKYRVRVNGNPTEELIEPLRQGLTVEGEHFQGMTVNIDKIQGANAWLTVGIREGKNREIRRAINYIGLIVNRLIRVSYGPFKLGVMEPGEVEEVKPRVLRDQLGMEGEVEPPLKPRVRHSRPTGKPETRAEPSRPSSGRAAGPRSAEPAGRVPATGKAAGKPGGKTDSRWLQPRGSDPLAKPGARSGGKPGGKPGGKSGGKPGGRPAPKSGGKPKPKA